MLKNNPAQFLHFLHQLDIDTRSKGIGYTHFVIVQVANGDVDGISFYGCGGDTQGADKFNSVIYNRYVSAILSDVYDIKFYDLGFNRYILGVLPTNEVVNLGGVIYGSSADSDDKYYKLDASDNKIDRLVKAINRNIE